MTNQEMNSKFNELKEEIQSISKKCDDIFSTKKLSNYLDISVNTIYRYVKNKNIPYHRIGGKNLFFIKSEIIDWMKGRKHD